MKCLFCYMPPTPNKIWQDNGQQNNKFWSKHKCFRKNGTITYLTITPSKSFYIIFVDIFSEIINPLKKSIEFEIDNLFKIDTRSSKKI